MADHWEFAWQHARGDFVIVNSDDDVFSPQLLTDIDTASRHIVVGLASWDAGLYYHPDWNLSGANTFNFEASHTGLIFEINSWKVFEAYAALNILRCFPLGTRVCFSRELGERVRKRVGRLFWTPYPDYSAPLLLLALMEGHERYLYFDSVLGYGGRSRNSNAAATVPKEDGRAGNAARVQEFIDEHRAESMFGDLEFQALSLTNGHAQTLALLRRLLPETFSRFHLDLIAYIAGIECEFQGINVNNPWLGPEERSQFDRFLARQDKKIVREAFQYVEQRWFDYKMALWQNDWRNVSVPVFRYALRPRVIGQVFRKILRRLLRLLTRPDPANSKERAQPGIRAELRGAMVTVHCDSFGGRDGLDLARRLDEIVSAFDNRDTRNLIDFYSNGYIFAAHMPESFSPQVAAPDS